MSIQRGIYAAGDMIQQSTAVHNTRRGIYLRKAEIVKTPMVREIIHAVTDGSLYLPKHIMINRGGIITRPYDIESGTYHPNGIGAYVPEIVFDYEIACAICLIIQDIYPNAYVFPNVTINVLNEQLANGTWATELILNPEYIGKEIMPKFNIDDVATVPLEEMPIRFDDPTVNPNSKLPNVSLWLSIAGIALCWVTFIGGMMSVAGIVTGIIGLRKSTKKKKCIAGIIMGAAGAFVLPVIVAIISLMI